MSSPLQMLGKSELRLVKRGPPPKGSQAMKATLAKQPFDDPDWIFERKLDGIRCIAVRSGGAVKLRSRNDLSLNDRYPEIAAALEQQPCERFAVDGEVVAFQGSATSFARLAQRRQHYVPVYYYVFDLLWLDGFDLRPLPLRARKRLLPQALRFEGHVRRTPYRNAAGEAFFEQACRKGWEGLIGKRANGPYADRRSRDWLKFKCERGQELVIGGFTSPQGSRTEFGALLLGYHERGRLRYAGKVGTGFDHASLRELGQLLRARRVPESPFVDVDVSERGVTWVDPVLVAQVAFTEWTAHGRLRHPRFLGLREDRPAVDVVRER